MSDIRSFLLIFSSFISLYQGFYDKAGLVKVFDSDSFKEKVVDNPTFWFIEFYAPWCGHCKALTEHWKKAASSLEGILKVGAIDADAHKDIASEYKIEGYPTIAFFAENKKKPLFFNGERTAEALVKFAMSELQKISFRKCGISESSEQGSQQSSGGEVLTLTEENFESTIKDSSVHWLVEFFAPWCGHCKNLAPHYAEAAKKLAGKPIRLAAVDATVHQNLASKFGVRGYPTLKYIPAGSQNLYGDAVDYDGGRTASDIVSWCSSKAVVQRPTPKLIEMINQDVFDKECTPTSLCIIAFIPSMEDSSKKEREKMLSYLDKNIKDNPRVSGWLWSVGGTQMDFERALDIGGFGYPAMVAVHNKKKLFSILKGAFDEKGIKEFLQTLQTGRIQLSKFTTLPKITPVTAWDGNDAMKSPSDEL